MTFIDEGELERLKQKQIKDYNPNLKSLSNLQQRIDEVFDNPDLTADEKCKALSLLQEKFNSLYTKYRNHGQPMLDALGSICSLKPPTTSDLSHPSIPGDGADHPSDIAHDIGNIALGNPTSMADEGEAVQAPNKEVEASTSPVAVGTSNPERSQSVWPSAKEINLPDQYLKKYQEFIDFLNHHAQAIRRNHDNLLVIDEKPIPNSSFNDLMRSMYVKNINMNLIGQSEFLSRLHELSPSLSIFSNKESISALLSHKHPKNSTPLRTALQKGNGKIYCSKRSHLADSSLFPPPGKKPQVLKLYRI